ncbi:MAG: transketolase family protein [Synergistaceae bacterium]|jgi:transketolase|nr:transketolase family protein [Synergistaceae bacterium]
MLEYNKLNIRTWSILGSRGTYGHVLNEIAGYNGNIVALTADLCVTSGLERYRLNHQERFINIGIAEQNMVGIAAGLAAGGMVPFISSFSNFLAMRSCEQMRHFLGYMNENVKAVGLAAGFAMGMFGVTHYGIEDIAALRAISNLTVISPADCTETAKAIEAAAEFDGPAYIRLTGVMNAPIVYRQDYDFKIGKAIFLRDGRDVCVIATGASVHHSLTAAEILSERGVDCAVMDVHTIKPLDGEAIEAAVGGKRLIVTVEEHSVVGGLGGAVAESLAGLDARPPHLIIGIQQGYPRGGSYTYLLEQCGLTGPKIADRITERLRGA